MKAKKAILLLVQMESMRNVMRNILVRPEIVKKN